MALHSCFQPAFPQLPTPLPYKIYIPGDARVYSWGALQLKQQGEGDNLRACCIWNLGSQVFVTKRTQVSLQNVLLHSNPELTDSDHATLLRSIFLRNYTLSVSRHSTRLWSFFLRNSTVCLSAEIAHCWLHSAAGACNWQCYIIHPPPGAQLTVLGWLFEVG